MRISMLLLKRRKMFSSVLAFVIALATLLNITTSMLTQSVLQYKWEKSLKTYGSFSCGLSQINEEIKFAAQDAFGGDHIGCYEIYDEVIIEENTITIGKVDNAFLHMANSKLLSGRFPANQKEVVVESFVANLLDGQEFVEVKLNTGIERFRIVGIIENYSANISTPEELEVGKNTYPSIICAEDNVFSEKDSSQFILIDLSKKMSARNGYVKNTQIVDEEIQRAGIPLEKIFYNNNLFNKGLDSCYEIWLYGVFFYFAVIIVVSIGLYVLLRIFYKNYRMKLSVIEVCGGQANDSIQIMIRQMLTLWFTGTGIGMVTAVIFSKWMNGIVGIEMSGLSREVIIGFLFGEIVLAAVLLLVVYQYKVETGECSIADNLHNRRKHHLKRKYKGNLIKQLGQHNVKMTTLLIGVFLITFFSLYIYNMTTNDNPNLPDYQLFSKEIVISEIVNGFNVEDNPDSFIAEADIKELEKYEDSIKYDLRPNFTSYSILFDKETIPRYFLKWNAMHESMDTSYEDSIIKKNWPEEMKNMVPIQNVDFIVANDQMIDAIIEQNHLEISKEHLENNNEVILFLPTLQNSQEEIMKNQVIKIGGIRRDGDKVKGEQFVCNIGAIVKDNYHLEDGNRKWNRDGITVVLTEDMAKQSKIFHGYRALSVFLEEEASDVEMRNINDLMNEISSKIQGGVLYSKRTVLEDERLFTSYNKLLAILLIGINIIFSIIIIVIFAYQLVVKNKKIFGILQALGMSKQMNILKLRMCAVKSLLLSQVFSTVIVLVFIGDLEHYKYYMTYYFTATAHLILLSGVACIVIGKMISKIGINDMIKEI